MESTPKDFIFAFNDKGENNINKNNLSSYVIEYLQKAIDGTLTQSDKDYLTERAIFASYGSAGQIPQYGIIYDFSSFMNTYLYKQTEQWREMTAFNKTSLRYNVFGRIDKIIKLDV